jgi:tRNA threonylcarbamoyladenosine biosynthesis protein TsaB
MSVLTLVLDGSTYATSVALLRDKTIIAERQASSDSASRRDSAGDPLVPLIQECLSSNGLNARDLNSVVCGAGPGSFTSLRIAASVGKGIAGAIGIELYAVPSLLLTVAGLPEPPASGNYLSVLPAMRSESFAALVAVSENGAIELRGATRIVPDGQLEGVASENHAVVIGPGKRVDALPLARGAARVLEDILGSGPVDLASWEPAYGRLAEAQVRWEAAHGRPLKA